MYRQECKQLNQICSQILHNFVFRWPSLLIPVDSVSDQYTFNKDPDLYNTDSDPVPDPVQDPVQVLVAFLIVLKRYYFSSYINKHL